jgi:hypothetical protein
MAEKLQKNKKRFAKFKEIKNLVKAYGDIRLE